MSLLHDGAFRYNDTLEGQLGEVLFFPNVVDLLILSSKTDCSKQASPRRSRGRDPAHWACSATLDSGWSGC